MNPFFNQYLRTIKIPTLAYTIENNVLTYKWTNIIEDFKMPLKVFINDKEEWLYPTSENQKISFEIKDSTFKVDPNFYIFTKN